MGKGVLRCSFKWQAQTVVQMRARKAVIFFSSTLVFALQLALFYVGAAQVSAEATECVIAQLLDAFSSLYIVFFTAFYFNQEDFAHSRAVIHLSILTSLPIFLATFVSISTSSAPGLHSTSFLVISQYTIGGLRILSWLVAITIPRGPQLHFPPESIYTLNVVPALVSAENNVSGSNGQSSMCSLC